MGQWPTLRVYLTDGRVEIDNNLVENAIRHTALGKKNWLFVGEAEAGDRSAVIYTIIESCRRRCLDPYAYLRDVLTRLPTMTNHQVHEVTPANWAKTPLPQKATAQLSEHIYLMPLTSLPYLCQEVLGGTLTPPREGMVLNPGQLGELQTTESGPFKLIQQTHLTCFRGVDQALGIPFENLSVRLLHIRHSTYAMTATLNLHRCAP